MVDVLKLKWIECAINQRNDLRVPTELLAVRFAECSFGTYAVVKTSDGHYKAWFGSAPASGWYSTTDEAKAAAQADFEWCIRSTLSPPKTQPVGEAKRLTWADERMALHWIDRYAGGVDAEPQMDRILKCAAALEAAAAPSEPVADVLPGAAPSNPDPRPARSIEESKALLRACEEHARETKAALAEIDKAARASAVSASSILVGDPSEPVAWRDISTAPDEQYTSILSWSKEQGQRIVFVGYHHGERRFYDSDAMEDGCNLLRIKPTHWRPLPPAPSSHKGDA